MIKNYFLIAFRYLVKYKSYSFINIIGFSIALVPVILTLLYVNYEFSFDKFHKNQDRIYRITLANNHNASKEMTPMTPAPLKDAIIADLPEVEALTRICNSSEIISRGENKFEENNFFYADPDIFKIFSFDIISGAASNPISDQFSVFISESKAKQYFGNLNPIGRILSLRNMDELTVKGVFKDFPSNSHFKPEFILNISRLVGEKTAISSNTSTWGFWRFYNYILLKENSSPSSLPEKISGLFSRYSNFSNKIISALQPLTDIHLHSKLVPEIEKNGNIDTMYLFISIAAVLFLIAVINYINLSTARTSLRIKEIGIRKISGAKKGQLITQFMGETLIITLCSLIISFFIIILIVPSFNQFVERSIPLNMLYQGKFIFSVIIFTLIAGSGAGVFHAFILSSIPPLTLFKNAVVNPGRFSLRNILISLQFVITIAFIFLILGIKNQLDYVNNSELGYSKNNITVFSFGTQITRDKAELLKNEILKNPSVTSATICYHLPNQSGIPENFDRTFFDKYLMHKMVDFDYIDFFGIKIIEGRKFDRNITSDEKDAVIINETAARLLGFQNPVGESITHTTPWGSGKRKIIGVMKDYYNSMHEKITPIYLTIDQQPYYDLCVKTKPGTENEVIAFSKKVFSDFYPEWLFKSESFSDILKAAYKTDYKDRDLFILLFTLTIAIVFMGLIGFVSFTASRRKKEIGIRKVLGAGSFDIVILLTKQFSKSVLISNLIALPAGFYLISKWLQNFAYKDSFNVWLFIIPGMITLIFVIVVVSLQSLKAAVQNPVDSIRNE